MINGRNFDNAVKKQQELLIMAETVEACGDKLSRFVQIV
jgi:hypothetical protein